MRTSGPGLELIQSFEGFRARATELSNGKWIIGFGHTDRARQGLRITREDASLVLIHHDLPPIEKRINERVLTPLSQNEFDALVSFVFNIGVEAFTQSDVLMHLNRGHRMEAISAMQDWRRGRVGEDSFIIDTLVRRRAAEIALFLEHPSGRVALPSALVRAERDTAPGTASERERTVIVEPRLEAERALATRASGASVIAEQARQSVTERTIRILREQGAVSGAETGLPGTVDDVTVEEITRAISVLAEPGDANPPTTNLPDGIERRKSARRDDEPPSPLPLKPLNFETPSRDGAHPPVIDDLTPAQPDPDQMKRALVEDEIVHRRPPAAGWFDGFWMVLPYGLVTGLGAIGMFKGAKEFMRFRSEAVTSEADLYAGPVLMLLAGLLFVMGLYYLYRTLTRKDT